MKDPIENNGFLMPFWTSVKSFWSPPVTPTAEAPQQHNQNIKEIALCLLLVFVFSKVDQARQYIEAFADFLYHDIHNDGYSILKFSLFVLSHAILIFWLAFVFWQKPLKLIKARENNKILVSGFSTDKQYYGRFSNIWRTAMIAALPFVIFYNSVAVALLKEEALGEEPSWWWDHIFSNAERSSNIFLWANLISMGVYFLTGAICRSNLFRPIFGRLQRPLYAILLMVGVATAAIIMGYNYSDPIRHFLVFKYLVLGFYIIVPALATALLFYGMARRLVLDEPEFVVNRRRVQQIVEVMKWVSLALIIVIFIALNTSSVTQQEWFSNSFFPTSVIIFAFICYYTLLDLLSFNVRLRFVRLGLVILVFAVFFGGINRHYFVKFNAPSEMGMTHRISFEKYFLTWANQRLESGGDSHIYLVAAEGGGSRAGAWTSTILTTLDSASNGLFRHRCFAFSGVSGGSLGFASTIAVWDNANRQKIANVNYDNLRIKNYVNKVFGRNYVTSALAGIFFYDFIQQIPLLNAPFTRHLSRTDRLNNEECDAVQQGLCYFFDSDSIPAEYLKKTNFLSLYYEGCPKAPIINTQLPLFFSNTARVQDGKRGILSAVRKDATFNPSSLDIIGMCQRETKKSKTVDAKSFEMGLGGVTGLSELFPFVNSTVTFGDSIGTFMDGGIYEDFGITTLHEVWDEIRSVCDHPDTNLIKDLYAGQGTKEVASKTKNLCAFLKIMSNNITVLLIHAREVKPFDDKLDDEGDPPAQFISPLSTLLQTPFAGHSDYVYHTFKKQLTNKSPMYEFILHRKREKEKPDKEITMSRWLSLYELHIMSNIATDELKHNKVFLDSFRLVRSSPPSH